MNAQCFRYEDAMFSTDGRSFQGCRAITVEEDIADGHDLSTRTTYSDRFPLTGRPLHVAVRRKVESTDLDPIKETVSDWRSILHADGSHFLYLARNDDYTYNVDRPTRPLMQRPSLINEYSADDFANGNVGRASRVEEVFSGSKDEALHFRNSTTTDHDYDYDYTVTGTGWYDKLVRKTVTIAPTVYGASFPGPRPDAEQNIGKTLVEDYLYRSGSRRLLEGVIVQQGVASQESTKSYQYDTYGNLQRQEVTALDAATSRDQITYWGTDGYFPVYVIEGGFTTFTEHDPRFGKVSKITTPDGKETATFYNFAGQVIWRHTTGEQPAWSIQRWCTEDCDGAVSKAIRTEEVSPTRTVYRDVLAGL